MKKLKR